MMAEMAIVPANGAGVLVQESDSPHPVVEIANKVLDKFFQPTGLLSVLRLPQHAAISSATNEKAIGDSFTEYVKALRLQIFSTEYILRTSTIVGSPLRRRNRIQGVQ